MYDAACVCGEAKCVRVESVCMCRVRRCVCMCNMSRADKKRERVRFESVAVGTTRAH